MKRKKALKKHRDMWRWIAERYRSMEPMVVPAYFLKECYVTARKEEAEHYCYLCEYAEQERKAHFCSASRCAFCPAQWPVDPIQTGYMCELNCGSPGLWKQISELSNTLSSVGRFFPNEDYEKQRIELIQLCEEMAELKPKSIPKLEQVPEEISS